MVTLEDARLEEGLMQAGDGACVMAPDGRITLWNDAAERMLGRPAREVLGRRCCDVFAGRDRDGNLLCYPACRMRTLMGRGERVQHFEMHTQARDRRELWLDVSVLVLPSANGAEGVYLFRDVTGQKHLADLLRERGAPRSEAGGDPEPGAATLTRRETEVLGLVAQGHRTKAVAERLHVSTATVRNHVQNILGKLGAHNRLEAVAYATRHRLL
jgi:PAS domain S-box-containing protein